MYIDFKIALWERIKIPKSIEKDFKEKVLNGEITSFEDMILYIDDNKDFSRESLLESTESIKVENNDGEATLQFFDNNHNLIFSNDNIIE